MTEPSITWAQGTAGCAVTIRPRQRGRIARQLDRLLVNARGIVTYSPFGVVVENLDYHLSLALDATVQLEVYGQRSKEVLPLVADLAAGMRKDLGASALVVGKALSGSAEGFESLRNEYGITSAELKRFGAVLNETGGLSLRTSAEIAKAGNALQAIIKRDFSGAIERQSQTLNGQLSNLADTFIRIGNNIGQALIPAVSLGAKGIGILASAVEAIPGPLVSMGASAGLAVAGLAGLGGGGIAATQAVLDLNKKLQAAATALPVLQPLAGRVATVLEAAGVKAKAFAQALLGINPALLGIGAATGIAIIAVQALEEHYRRLGETIQLQAKTMADNSQGLRELRDLLNSLGGGQVSATTDTSAFFDQLAASIESVPAVELARALEKAGHSSESLKKSLASNRSEANQYRSALVELKAATEGIANLPGNTVAIPAAARQFFGGRSRASLEEVNQVMEKLNFQFGQLGQRAGAMQSLVDVLEQLSDPMAKLVEDSKSIDGFLKFSRQIGDAQTLQTGLEAVNEQLIKLRSFASEKGIPVDTAGLLNILQTEPGSTRAAFAEELLNKQRAAEDFADAQKALDEKRVQERVQAIDDGFRREHLAREASLREMIAVETEKLNVVQAGSNEELAILERRADLERQLREKGTKRVEEAARSQAQSILDTLDLVKSQSGASSQEAADAYEVVITRLERLGEAYKNTSPELTKFVNEQIKSAKAGRDQALALVPKENFKALNDSVTEIGAGPTKNTLDELRQVDAQIRLVEQARRRLGAANLDEASTTKLLTQLGQQRLQVEQRIAQARQQAAQELRGLELSAQDQMIQELEARAAAGEDVEKKLQQARLDRLNLALEAIDAETQAEIEATGLKEEAVSKAELKKTALLRAFSLEQFQRTQAGTRDARAQLEQQDQDYARSLDRRRGLANRAGGPQSPLQSFEEAFGAGNGFNFTGVEQSSFGRSALRPTAPKVPRLETPEQVRQRVAASQKPGQAQLADGPGSRVRPDGSKIYNTTISVDGQFGRLSDPEVNRLVDAVVGKLGRRIEQKRRTGPAPGQSFRE